MAPTIHEGEDPFAEPLEARSTARRLRGRFVAPVTVWTTGDEEAATGLTISSTIVAEGEPSVVLGLVADTTDLYAALSPGAKAVVHVLDEEAGPLGDRFAGLRPSPGGLFVGLDWQPSDYGPVLAGCSTLAYCTIRSITPAGYQQLVDAAIDSVELGPFDSPLVRFRGRYRKLVPRDTP